MKSKTLTVSIDCSPKKVYAFVSNAKNLPKWAKTFCKSVKKTGRQWLMNTSLGPLKLRFAPKNNLGVLDHFIKPPKGQDIVVPMRVISNGKTSEVVFTLFQRPGMTDADFYRDIGMVQQDLKTLRAALE